MGWPFVFANLSGQVPLANLDSNFNIAVNLTDAQSLTNKTLIASKNDKLQVGVSATATHNFTLTAEADDGTMKLARGNAGGTTQDIFTVNAAGLVVLTQNVQTWQNMSGSRVAGTTYTNNTGQPIQVAVFTNASVAPNFKLTVGLIDVYSVALGAGVTGSFTLTGIVPNGESYSVTAFAGTLNSWKELR
jgi:hypothetical protein